jgi:hypothetical protein
MRIYVLLSCCLRLAASLQAWQSVDVDIGLLARVPLLRIGPGAAVSHPALQPTSKCACCGRAATGVFFRPSPSARPHARML